jgi:DNA-binding MarR family transcriptional regulator
MDAKNDETVVQAFGRLERIINKFRKIEKQPKDLGTGELLYIGEVHTIVAVGKYPGINITELSFRLGITKGAVSQAIGKLEKRNYLRRIKDNSNEKNVLVELTEKGGIVIKEHDRFHRDFFSNYLRDITFGQIAVFNEVLEKIESFMDNSLDSNN